MYGEDYSLFILGEINSYDERGKEYEWMVKLQSHIKGRGYNYNERIKMLNTHKNRLLPLKSGVPEIKENI